MPCLVNAVPLEQRHGVLVEPLHPRRQLARHHGVLPELLERDALPRTWRVSPQRARCQSVPLPTHRIRVYRAPVLNPKRTRTSAGRAAAWARASGTTPWRPSSPTHRWRPSPHRPSPGWQYSPGYPTARSSRRPPPPTATRPLTKMATPGTLTQHATTTSRIEDIHR